jgi:7-cyano-7-deazaguanine synthase in queuosine biosynthesis
MPTTYQKTKYDCIIPWSGGTESTAVVYDCVQRGLNPLCFHVELGVHWQQQVNAVEKLSDQMGVDVRFIEYFNQDPCVDRAETGKHWEALWGANCPPMFFVWTNIAQLVNLNNPQIHKIYYGFNGGVREAGDGKGDRHTEWVDDHFRSIERVLARLNIPTKMSAPLGHMSKREMWEMLPADIQEHVHTCVHPSDRHCGNCTKCREFNYMLGKDI